MRVLQGKSLCAVFLGLLPIAHCLSVRHGKRAHHHALRHAGNDAAPSGLSERASDSLTSFSIELINNLDSDDIHAYIVTNKPMSDQAILITASGEEYHPVSYNKGQATPIPADANCGIPLGGRGSSVKINMPVTMQKGRVYVAKGELTIGYVTTHDVWNSLLTFFSFPCKRSPSRSGDHASDACFPEHGRKQELRLRRGESGRCLHVG